MTELVFVRHAEADCNVTGIVGGPNSCTGLTTRGLDQARRLAQRLYHESEAGNPVARLYASPRRRAWETAEILAAELALPVAGIPDLRDPDYGDEADGQLWTQLLAAAPHIDPRDLPLRPGGESWTRYVARTDQTVRRLLTDNPTEGSDGNPEGVTASRLRQFVAGLAIPWELLGLIDPSMRESPERSQGATFGSGNVAEEDNQAMKRRTLVVS